ncbi:hypothetical protein RclHR1_28970001 [Rhizophagus clarus]|uniref:Transposase domain-containing protein n=1 Tax=Rhizophagus clarus TaxID=94130 RepID=A0A2Z6RY44_9GLOM|nr:hypothetical protein RclHR1_28970001 [Rhizophagus clarus]
MSTRVRDKVPCDCKNCDEKLVDERTRNKHAELERNLASRISGFILSLYRSSVKSVLEGNDDFNPIEPIYEEEDDDDDKDDDDDDEDNDDDEEDDDDDEEDDDDDKDDDDDDEDDDKDDDDQEEDDDDDNYEQFDASNTNFDYADSWIVLWILKYQSRFRLPDVTINVLIKFFCQVLQDINHMRYKEFPSSLHIAKKLLKVSKWLNYAVCQKCNTLYNAAEVLKEDDFKCSYIEFPSHPMRTKRKPCGVELTEQVPIIKGLNGMMTDVYDGEIWKNFPSQMDNSELRFFTKETVDSNLGPSEVKLDKINNYFTLIINELLDFWNGVKLPTKKCPNEHKHNAAIWKQQNTEEDRRQYVSETHVRWSEMLRLPYHDLIRHLVIDLMHNLFLGIAQWIIKKLWIEGNKIFKADLEIMERRAKGIKIPTNLGRASYKIVTGESSVPG